MFRKLYKAVLFDVCCLCDARGLNGLDLCLFCHKSLPHNHSCCYQCAAPFDPRTDNREQLICGRCLSSPAGIDHSIVPFLYRPPIDFMIKRLKFSEQMKFSRILGDLLADAVGHCYSSEGSDTLANETQSTDRKTNDAGGFPDVILPMPTHRERLLQRGFNQAQQIAVVVANRFSRTCNTTAVTRTASRRSQSSLSAAQREANIRRAFEIPNPAAIKGLHIAVVDDVYTTGATARAVARNLKSAGAARVSIWAVARTP